MPPNLCAAHADRDMLLIPYQTRFTLKSLPLVTLALILVNAVVYFVFQSGDRQAYARAADYYFSSQLAQIELPRYATYLDRRTDRGSLQVLRMIRAGARPEQSIRLPIRRTRRGATNGHNSTPSLGACSVNDSRWSRAWAVQPGQRFALLRINFCTVTRCIGSAT